MYRLKSYCSYLGTPFRFMVAVLRVTIALSWSISFPLALAWASSTKVNNLCSRCSLKGLNSSALLETIAKYSSPNILCANHSKNIFLPVPPPSFNNWLSSRNTMAVSLFTLGVWIIFANHLRK